MARANEVEVDDELRGSLAGARTRRVHKPHHVTKLGCLGGKGVDLLLVQGIDHHGLHVIAVEAHGLDGLGQVLLAHVAQQHLGSRRHATDDGHGHGASAQDDGNGLVLVEVKNHRRYLSLLFTSVTGLLVHAEGQQTLLVDGILGVVRALARIEGTQALHLVVGQHEVEHVEVGGNAPGVGRLGQHD